MIHLLRCDINVISENGFLRWSDERKGRRVLFKNIRTLNVFDIIIYVRIRLLKKLGI